jgi:hypothetical protein
MTILALDRSTVRSVDEDGRLHVAVTNISKANVCPYYGHEIPDADRLGLDRDRVYYLLRDPAELEKAAASFNSLPLLNVHVPVSADDHRPDIVVGATGTDAEFVAPYLRNSLVVWARDAIEAIESGEQRELSCAYRYVPVMEPGTYQGVRYDGRMTEIRGNHVALVPHGRAGSDVVVGDSKLKENLMARKAPNKKAAMVKGAITALRTKLAQDATVDDLVNLLDKADEKDLPDDDLVVDTDEPAVAEKKEDDQASRIEALVRRLEAAVAKLDKPAEDEPPVPPKDDDVVKLEGKEKPDRLDEDDKPSKAAMDAAITRAVKAAESATVKRLRDIADAEKVVRPYIGEIAVAQDSAEAVYKLALDSIGIPVDGVHPSAYRAILSTAPKPGERDRSTMARDSAGGADFETRFPNAARIRSI